MRFSAARGAQSIRPLAVGVTLALLVLIGLTLASAARSGVAATRTPPAAATATPNLRIQPAAVTPGASIVLTGAGFQGNEVVSFYVGPPRAGADLWGSTRAGATGGFRTTFTVNPAAGPGVFVVVACQRGCTIKASASFRITEMLLLSRISCKPCWVGIALFSLASRKQVALTRHAGWEDNGAVSSPDGKRVVFSRTTDGYRSFRLYVMSSDGRGVHAISRGRFDESPAWSPDGKWIAFQSSRGIELIRPNGTGRHTVAGTAFGAHPSWSPDGSRLAFAQNGFVWTARVDGHSRRRLAPGREPAWSPNGRFIAYVLPSGGVATIPAAGGRSRTLSPGLEPAWSPDSTRIAYTRWPPSNQFSVWVMNANGTGRRLVMGNAREPSWRP